MTKIKGLVYMRQLKQNWFTILLVIAMTILLVSPGAKTILLRELLRTGLFKADTGRAKAAVPFPETVFFLKDNGLELHIGSLRGKVIFLNLWANWCPVCLAEMETINRLHDRLKNDDRIRFILADTDNDIKKSLFVMKNNNYDLPVYGFSGAIPASLFDGSIPVTFIIDQRGNIVQKFEGLTNYDTRELLEYLRSLN